ncbi:unnamed protein product [Vicia faba]|uniref:Uncharacterized protein n=1 Tax=Vicia faba TaxID=3906 RepID=A0AAV0YWX2_VICFA|nr:unnamed protein product [Vicia faba]
MDFPLTIDLIRLLRGGPLMKYGKNEYVRIGDEDEVVVRGCRSLDYLVPKPDTCSKEFDYLSRYYEWRLNMQTGEVKEKDLCGDKVVYMNFSMINENFVGIKHKYAYTQVVDHIASSTPQDVQRYRGLANLLLPITIACVAKEQQELVDFESFFTHTICHECCHGIGPHAITLPPVSQNKFHVMTVQFKQ